MCFVCSQRFDQTGESIGYGDLGCWKEDGSINPAYMQVCPDGFDYCAVDMFVDWTLRGHQEMTIRRTCTNQKPASEPSNGVYPVHCISGDLGNGFEYRDCRQEFDANADEAANGPIAEIESQLGVSLKLCFGCDDHNPPNCFRVTKLILVTHVMTMDYVLIRSSTAKMFPLMKRKHYIFRSFNLNSP